MITKEECAELREQLREAGVAVGGEWRAAGGCDSDWVRNEDGDPYAVAVDPDDERLAAAMVNALPKLLDALDAADERIAGLEAELNKLKGCNCDDANHGLTLDHRCIACSHIENCEERIAQLESWGREDCEPLKARIAELEAAAQWRPIEEAPKDGKDWFIVARAGTQLRGPAYWCDGRWCQGVHEEPLHFTPTHFCELPDAPALPEGGV